MGVPGAFHNHKSPLQDRRHPRNQLACVPPIGPDQFQACDFSRDVAEIFETVAELPGLSSSCTMECGEGLLPAFGVGFTPHIQRKTRPDLRLRPHPVDTLVPLAIAPVAPLHGMGC